MPTFITPYSGSAELTTTTGLVPVETGLWRFSPPNQVDGATWGVSLTYPSPMESGLLHLRAQDWNISEIGNELTSYTDPNTGIIYGPERCRIIISGRWSVPRLINYNSFNSFGVDHRGLTETNLGSRTMDGWLLSYTSPPASYVIQGSAVDGGAQDTFTVQEFWVKITETVSSDNSNRQFQSNSVASPVWTYQYSKSWQTD